MYIGILGSNGWTDEWTDSWIDELGPSGPRGRFSKLNCCQHPCVKLVTQNSLQVLIRSGTPKERKYAARISPVGLLITSQIHACTGAGWLGMLAMLQVVSKPHHTLVTLLLCNAVALEVGSQATKFWQATSGRQPIGTHDTHELFLVQALPIFLDRLVDPVAAVVLSVTVVLFFGKMSHHTCLLAN